MIINSQRTIYGLEYMTSKITGEAHFTRPNTTLNEKHNIQKGVSAAAGVDLGIKYLAIGIGGTSPLVGVTEYSYSKHGIADAALFKQVPFVARPASNDLTATEQARYRLRVSSTIGGVQHYLYYLRVIAPADMTRDTYLITPATTGPSTLSLFSTNTPTYLNPTPRNTGAIAGAGTTYISAMIKLKFVLTPAEMVDIQNSIDLLYGTTANKVISEIGVCGGADNPAGDEALEVQVHYHVGTGVDITMANDPIVGYSRAIELGGAEPLYA